jgi:polar amino acid transport system substrate-binding protein
LRLAVLLLLALLAACDLPKDSAATLERVRGGELRVGVTEHRPWARFEDGQAVGIEPALVQEWARSLGATIRWVRGAETELVEALDRREIDLLIAGLERRTPHAKRLGLTQPYLKTELRLAVPPGRTAPDDWTGQRVAVPPGHVGVAARLREKKAEAVEVTAGDDMAVAGYDFQLDPARFRVAGPVLATEERVMAITAGESAFLLALDRFLSDLGEERIRAIAAAEAAR